MKVAGHRKCLSSSVMLAGVQAFGREISANAYICGMSSHHFVREGQEPALLMVDVVSWEIIGPLLEWAPLVIVTDTVLETALQWGIKVDAVIGSAEQSTGLNDRLADQGPVDILIQAAGTDALGASLSYLFQTHQSAINIITADPSPLIDTIIYNTPPLDISLITTQHRWSLFKSGPYKKWHPAHTTLRIYRPGTPEEVTTPTDGLITLNPNTPFWIAEPL